MAIRIWTIVAIATPKSSRRSCSDLFLLSGVAALAASGAVRSGRFKVIAFVLALAGTVGVVVAEPILRGDLHLANAIYGVAGPVQAVGFVLAGVGVIISRRWTAWHRFTLLILGLYVPVIMMPVLILAPKGNLGALAGYHTCVLLVGIAALLEGRAQASLSNSHSKSFISRVPASTQAVGESAAE